jgi:hypothetical protein
MTHAAQVKCDRLSVLPLMIAAVMAANAGGAAAQVDSARMAQLDRVAHIQFVDRTPPPGGRFHIVSNAAFFQRLGWTNQQIWMYTDDQRFEIRGNIFGPVAFIAPADSVEVYRDAHFEAAGDTGLVVGAILVDTARGALLEEPYRSLNLAAGRNCIRLIKNGNNWSSVVYPASGGEGYPCALPLDRPPALRVWRAPALPTAGAENIPPVARWHEGKRGNGNAMNFGIKCADRWCVAIPPSNYDTLRLLHKSDHPQQRTWETHGWHDGQRLAVMNGEVAVPGRVRASIIPTARLNTAVRADFDTAWVHAATVVIKDSANLRVPLMGKYGRPPSGRPPNDYWGFLPGENYIDLRTTKDLELHPSGWIAQVRHPSRDDPHPLRVVERHDHKPKVLWGTARFRWLEHDDGDWIECDDGCCKIGVM